MQFEGQGSNREYAHQKVILLVVNNDDWLNAAAYVLSQDARYRVLVASNGLAVIKFLIYVTPQLLIMEDCLPDMSGIQLYDYLHANWHLATLPVIMLSANREDVKNQLATRHLIGIDRSFDAEKFMTTVETVLAASPSE